MAADRKLLIVGATGLAGGHAAQAALAAGWHVTGLSRGAVPDAPWQRHVALDLRDARAARGALKHLDDLTHLFICTWARHDTEAENVAVNRAMLETLFDALPDGPLQHIALVTGLKHYLGPFESYGTAKPYAPFLESQPRLPVANFYYDQEDVVFFAGAARQARWSVHRPHTMIGLALGNAMNMAVTLAVYASICRETGRPFRFPGSPEQYKAVADVTDARLLARQLLWAAETPATANLPFNTANGDLFRWYWLWDRIAAYFELAAAPYPGHATPLATQMADASPIWDAMVATHALQPWPLHRLASFWHTDADLGREIECFTDMTNSRRLGFHDHQITTDSFTDVFDALRAQRVIPD